MEKTVKYFNKNNMIYVSLNINVDTSGKKIVNPITKWRNLKTNDKCKEKYDKKVLGIGLMTGEINNITVLDCDTEVSFETLNEYLPKGCVIVETKKGYHVYFSYNKNFKNNSQKFKIKDIDCRNNGGFIICPPSQYSDKSYKYTFKSFDGNLKTNISKMKKLPEIPDEIIKLLIKDEPKGDIKTNKYIHNVMNKTTKTKIKLCKKTF